jgi:hypothetical protein
MIRKIPSKRFIAPKILRSIAKPDKNLIYKTRKYIQIEDQNKRFEDQNMQRTMLTSTAVSRFNAIDADKKDLMKQQKKASEIIRQLNMEHDTLQRNFDKKEKLAIEDRKVRDKIENLQITTQEQERDLKQYRTRQTELKDYEQTVAHYENITKQLQHQEQLEKDKHEHEKQVRTLQHQVDLAEEQYRQYSQRNHLLSKLTKHEHDTAEAKRAMLYQQENNKYIKKLEKLVTEAAVAKTKAEGFKQLSIAQKEHTIQRQAIQSNQTLVRDE